VPPVRTRAVILHAFPYGDTSRILRLLTEDLGLRSVIAKGARSPRSRFGGILEPFTEGEAHFVLRDGRDLFTLSGFTLLRSRQSIGRDLAAFSGASLLAEIILRAGTEESQPAFYRALVRALDRLADPGDDPATTALTALWWLLALLGFQPEMQTCVRCGRPLGDAESTRFDIEAGGAACQLCRPAGRQLPPTARREILVMCGGSEPDPPIAELRIHAGLLQAFLSTHLALDRPLRALPLFLEHLR
jgi:DNA repair protein RecO (recombination protein O)